MNQLNTFSYKNLLFDKTINVCQELELNIAVFSSKSCSKNTIFSHCDKEVSKCKNVYYFTCFISSKTDEFGNVMTYYINDKFIIVKCIKPSKPIPVIICYEITIPHGMLFVVKSEIKNNFTQIDILNFINEFLSNPNILFKFDIELINSELEKIESEEDYNFFELIYKDQLEQVKTNRRVLEYYLQICEHKHDENFDPYGDAYKLMSQLSKISNQLNYLLTKTNQEFDDFHKKHKELMQKFEI